MNQFFLSGDELLAVWRDFRLQTLSSDMTDLEHLTAIAIWWQTCPVGNRTIDPYTSTTWPTAWELIYQGDFCKSAIGLGMEQTLLLRNGRWNSDRIKLALVDENGADLYLAPIIDDKWILNYEHGVVTLLADTENLVIKDTYIFKDGKHISC